MKEMGGVGFVEAIMLLQSAPEQDKDFQFGKSAGREMAGEEVISSIRAK